MLTQTRLQELLTYDPATELLAHLVWMASMEGAKEHAWHMAKLYAHDYPDLWGDLPQRLTQAMRTKA